MFNLKLGVFVPPDTTGDNRHNISDSLELDMALAEYYGARASEEYRKCELSNSEYAPDFEGRDAIDQIILNSRDIENPYRRLKAIRERVASLPFGPARGTFLSFRGILSVNAGDQFQGSSREERRVSKALLYRIIDVAEQNSSLGEFVATLEGARSRAWDSTCVTTAMHRFGKHYGRGSDPELIERFICFITEKISGSEIAFDEKGLSIFLQGLKGFTTSELTDRGQKLFTDLLDTLVLKMRNSSIQVNQFTCSAALIGCNGITTEHLSSEGRKAFADLLDVYVEKIFYVSDQFDGRALAAIDGLRGTNTKYLCDHGEKALTKLLDAIARRIETLKVVPLHQTAQALSGVTNMSMQFMSSDGELALSRLYDALAFQIENSTEQLDIKGIRDCFDGLAAIDTPNLSQDGQRSTARIVAAVAAKVSQSEAELDNEAIRRGMRCLHGFQIHCLAEVGVESLNVFVGTLAEKILASKVKLEGKTFGAGLSGLRGFHTDSMPEELQRSVAKLLYAFSKKLNEVKENVDVSAVGGLYGFHGMVFDDGITPELESSLIHMLEPLCEIVAQSAGRLSTDLFSNALNCLSCFATSELSPSGHLILNRLLTAFTEQFRGHQGRSGNLVSYGLNSLLNIDTQELSLESQQRLSSYVEALVGRAEEWGSELTVKDVVACVVGLRGFDRSFIERHSSLVERVGGFLDQHVVRLGQKGQLNSVRSTQLRRGYSILGREFPIEYTPPLDENAMKHDFLREIIARRFPDSEIQFGTHLDGFEMDVVVLTEAKPLLNLELDGRLHDMGANRRRDRFRDRYLSQRHGITIVRCPIDMGMSKVNIASDVGWLLDQIKT